MAGAAGSTVGPSMLSAVPGYVPEDLSDDPFDPNFVFEGYLETLTGTTTKSSKELDAKCKRMQDYQELEARLETRRVNKARKAAAARGVAFDERKQVAAAVTDYNQVWSLHMDDKNIACIKQASRNKMAARQFVGADVDDKSDFPKFPIDRNRLVSGYNGYDMTSFPWRTQGCLSSTEGTSGCSCSGTKISARLVLTAGHCLSKGDGTSYSNVKYWLPGANEVSLKASGKDDTPNGAKVITSKLFDPAWFFNAAPHRDWALLVLEPSSTNCKLGWLGYKVPERLEFIHIYGYPVKSTCEASPFLSKLCLNSLYGKTKKSWESRQ